MNVNTISLPWYARPINRSTMDLWSCMLCLAVEYSGHVLNMFWGMPIVCTYKVISGAQKGGLSYGEFECQSLDKILQSHNWECI
jgi:hypothetical protein